MKTYVYNLVLGFTLTLFCISVNAQEYQYIPMVKPGVQIWTDDYWDCGGNYHFRRFALTNEDTIIETQTYKKLYFFTDSVFNPLTTQGIGGLGENEQKQVFYKGDYIDGGNVYSSIICDFSLSVGDTFADIYQLGFTFQIKSIDTIEFAGSQRRIFTVVDKNSPPPSHLVAKWIEGIGNTEGLLYDMSLNMTSCMNGGNNRCYEYNGELQYHNYENGYGIEDCYSPLLGINEIQEEDNTVSIYPNPAIESITISSDNIIKCLEIYNPLGQRVYQAKVNAKTKSIDINSLPKGIYIIGVNTEEGYIKKKFIKN